jgi:hypothetical protein
LRSRCAAAILTFSVATVRQLEILGMFETARAANPLFCHQEFLEKLAEHDRDALGRRAAFLLQRLSLDARRLHYKATAGLNRGWRRSRLGGNYGSHFYAWWAPKNALPLQESGDFADVPDGSIFLRDIRHHDDHSQLTPQSFSAHYMPVTVRDLRGEEYAPRPWTPAQQRFASGRQSVRLLKGHPGSGKTTALWHAADSAAAEHVLYVTYSPDLAALAKDYFERFCSSEKQFSVVTFPSLVRQILAADVPMVPLGESRERFSHDLAPFVRTLGAWATCQTALYDELHAHLAGDALPVALGRFSACKTPRVSDKAYRERRTQALGESAVKSALELAARLEHSESRTLNERYFPELGLAWQAVEKLSAADAQANWGAFSFDYDCVAVDECQDLTPIEAWLLVELVSRLRKKRHLNVSLLLAGDEAQTVRPTDFEWGWLSDLLHTQLATPSEYKLSANLRSPRRIAGLVNRAWDLYAHVQKSERPSGIGQAEVEDDATDQILYCCSSRGPELDALLTSLSTREGLALITLEDSVPAWIPEAAREVVLTVSEAKGLDFHSVCVLDPGTHIDRVLHQDSRLRSGSEIQGLRKRLAIDQLRVALSRPAERLIWLDVNPTEQIVRNSLNFLNGNAFEGDLSSCVPAALLKTLEEDELDLEERIQRCQADARQYLGVKPELAWSRAHQAVTLLGQLDSPAAVLDHAVRQTAYLTVAEICFTLGIRNVRLAAELGRPDPFEEGRRAALNGGRIGLSLCIAEIGRVHRASYDARLVALQDLARTLPRYKDQIEPWLLIEIGSRANGWVEELESALVNGHNANVLLSLLPPLYEVLGIPNHAARSARLQDKSIQLLMKERHFAKALEVLRSLPNRQSKLEASCLQALGDFREAAEAHLAAGNLPEALNCYRSAPDLEQALKLVAKIGEHPAAQSLEWIAKLQKLVVERPDKFTKLVTPAEKEFLQDLLEKALGVSRRKPVPRPKVKKTLVPRKPKPNSGKGKPIF